MVCSGFGKKHPLLEDLIDGYEVLGTTIVCFLIASCLAETLLLSKFFDADRDGGLLLSRVASAVSARFFSCSEGC